MKVENLCCTSIEDARSSLNFIDDLKFLKKALLYEICHFHRTTMIKMLKSKIRKIDKKNKKHLKTLIEA